MSNVLYELSDDPDDALGALLERYGDSEVELLKDVEALLADVSVNPETVARICAVYDSRACADHRAIRGPLGLCLLLSEVTTASLREHQPDAVFERANALLGAAEVRESLRSLYRLADDEALQGCDLDDAWLYKIGTTSMIVRCETLATPKRPVVLKCVLPRHFSVRAIAEDTERCRERHKAVLSLAPAVYGSNERAVMMELIEGPTLAERLQGRQVLDDPDDRNGERQARKRALGQADIAFIRDLGRTLCDALARLHRSGQCHLDLSPRNIIIVGEKPLTARLIDFGRNFAIAEGVASSLALARASVYVEPAMVAHQREGDWRSDCYSLGIILLEAAARRPLHRATIARELWRLWTGEHPWDGAPGLARIIEDLIDAHPDQRLTFMSRQAM